MLTALQTRPSLTASMPNLTSPGAPPLIQRRTFIGAIQEQTQGKPQIRSSDRILERR